MTKAFAAGKKAFGFCDRCGFRAKLSALKGETVRGKPKYNRVCPSCWDPDHPQNFQGMQDMSDPQALRDPRPDPALAESRRLFGLPNQPLTTETGDNITTETGDGIVTE